MVSTILELSKEILSVLPLSIASTVTILLLLSFTSGCSTPVQGLQFEGSMPIEGLLTYTR